MRFMKLSFSDRKALRMSLLSTKAIYLSPFMYTNCG